MSDDWFHILQGIDASEYRRRRNQTMPKTASKFTSGALRAALDIYADQFGVESAALDAGGGTHNKWASIIDRQTKASEMYELLAVLAEDNFLCDNGNSVCDEARRIKAEIDGEG